MAAILIKLNWVSGRAFLALPPHLKRVRHQFVRGTAYMRRSFSAEEAPSDIPNNLAGFESPGEVACAEFADAPLNRGNVISVGATQLVVELADGSSLEFKNWQGPALDGIFALGEAVDIAAPCSYTWSAVRGESGAVASLFETPFQGWPVQFTELEELPAFLGAPSFALRPYCQRDSRVFNALQVSLGDEASRNVTTPGSTQVGVWTVEFGGCGWCCAETGDEGFELPETGSLVFLCRVAVMGRAFVGCGLMLFVLMDYSFVFCLLGCVGRELDNNSIRVSPWL